MDPATKGLNDKLYEKRKTAALDLEKIVRECHAQGDNVRINQIIDQLVDLFATPSQPLHCRNGGLIGLAATAIALGFEISPYMEKFMDPLLGCFTDPEGRIRYFACESLYNIAKVAKGEILVYFNPIFDALSKLAADSELSVKNGAELLDRLLKDIVAESAPVHFPQYAETEKVRARNHEKMSGLGVLVPQNEDGMELYDEYPPHKKAFSLAHFMPLLAERIYVISPFTRSYLVSWIQVLDSVPDLELVTFLPEFLDGLLKYLSDPIEDVRVSTENLLAEFLQEVRDIAIAQKRREDKLRKEKEAAARKEGEPDLNEYALMTPERGGAFIRGEDEDDEDMQGSEAGDESYDRDTGAWIPGQGVTVNHPAIVEILIRQLVQPHDEIQQSTALRWIAEFMNFVPDVMVPFTPRLIPAILPNLAHHVPAMKSAAIETNASLFSLIQSLPAPPSQVFSAPSSLASGPVGPGSGISASTSNPLRAIPGSPTLGPTRQMSKDLPSSASISSREDIPAMLDTGPVGNTIAPSLKNRMFANAGSDGAASASTALNGTAVAGQYDPAGQSRASSPTMGGGPGVATNQPSDPPPASPTPMEDLDPFDYPTTVNALTFQFLSEHEETRVAALKWLLMLHQKAPRKILSMDDGTFPALLKTLSDPSEEVIKHDLQLLAQISSSSEEGYFKAFMNSLLELFSTDRRLLDQRGSLIIRQLCMSLNTERIYRSFAEILEKEEDLEFASIMVQKLNIILITSPELVEFRKRLKNLESKDGQALFSILYRSWCHNAVAVLSLCLLAQAYEHASNLLQIFADLEITVQLLVQIDKLVQLIESPVFTYLRLQLLEPEKYPYLFKCLYGLLMLLPQSSAFMSLRNRLNAVSSLGFVHIAPRSTVASGTLATRSKIVRDEIKWVELLGHFRNVQIKHEKSRRTGISGDNGSVSGFSVNGETGGQSSSSREKANGDRMGDRSNGGPGARDAVPSRPLARRKGSAQGGVLSPLNPKSRTGVLASLSSAGSKPAVSAGARPMSPPLAEKQRRALGLRK